MNRNINCQCFWNGQCSHAAATRRWFGPARCILTSSDPRIRYCSLQITLPRPKVALPGPPPPPRKLRGYINIDVSALILLGVVIGIVFATAVVLAAPVAWALLKPILHALTA